MSTVHSLAKHIALQVSPIRKAYQHLLRMNRWGIPSHSNDCLAVWNKSVEFLEEDRFKVAYDAGMGTGHRLDRFNPEADDIHIEWRIHVCCWAAWHASKLEGDFVECGTNTGIMSVAVCNYIDFNSTGKNFFLFDTFDGIPDDQIGAGEGHARDQNAVYRDVYETAKRNFAPWPKATLVRGRVPDTLSTQSIEKVAYMMIDMNIVTPERAALAHFWPRMVTGGIVLFDDYGWSGYHVQKTAHDEFAASQGLKILTLPTGQGMLLKP